MPPIHFLFSAEATLARCPRRACSLVRKNAAWNAVIGRERRRWRATLGRPVRALDPASVRNYAILTFFVNDMILYHCGNI